jgi:ADP-ribose pyrophosphatase YjhB (NUDIX family)
MKQPESSGVLNWPLNPKFLYTMIKFCSHCGASVSFEIPAGDALPRHVCKRCGHIHYENPRLVVGCVASWEDRILLCRRAIKPQLGYWTLPAGFMENGETTAEAATRETFEEAGAKIIVDAPFAMVSIAHINQVHLFYRGRLATADHAAGEESLEVSLVLPEDIPWQDMAFRSVTHCLERYLDDMARGCFGFHETNLGPMGRMA